MNLGIGLSICSGRNAGADFQCDPALLSLTRWSRTNYIGAPWAGEVSAGASGSFSWLSPGTAPTVGAGLNGLNPADFNGTTQRLYSDTTALSSILSPSAWWTGALIKADTVAVAAANWYDDEVVIGDNQGACGFSVSASGVRGAAYDGAIKATGFVAFPTGAWAWVELWLDSGTLSIAVNGGTAATVAVGNSAILGTSFPRMGANYNATTWFDGQIADEMAMASVPSLAVRTCLRENYLLERYGLTL